MQHVKVVISKDSVHAVSDWDVRAWYLNILETGGTAYVATYIMFNELRVGVRLGEIAPFTFAYDNKEISVGVDAKLSECPEGFMGHLKDQMFVIMTGRTMSSLGPVNAYHKAGKVCLEGESNGTYSKSI